MTQKDTISYNNPNRNKQVDIDKNYYVPAHVKMNVSPLEMEFSEEAQTIRLKENKEKQNENNKNSYSIEESIFNMQEEYALFLYNELIEVGDIKAVKMKIFNILSDNSYDCTIKDFFILKKIFPKVDIQV